MPERLRIANLVEALDAFQPTYGAVDVFANDVEELVSIVESEQLPPGIAALDPTGTRFQVFANDRQYLLSVLDQGVVRFEPRPTSGGAAPLAGAATFGALGAALGAASAKKGDEWAAGLLGVLVGAAIGAAAGAAVAPAGSTEPKWVFTVSFDPTGGRWRAYHGPLSGWAKGALSA